MATSTRRTAKKTAAKPAPKPAPEVVEEELEELETEADEVDGDEDLEADDMEELEEDEVSEAKPTTKKTSAAAQTVTFGIQDLIALIKKETGEDTDGRQLRTLIRKMARETDRKGGPRVQREITPGNRSRYDWTGPNDPEVQAILAAFKGGELEAEKQAKLKALKEQKAAKIAAQKAAAAEETEDDEEKPAARKTAAKKTSSTRRKPAPVVEEVEDDEELELDEDDE